MDPCKLREELADTGTGSSWRRNHVLSFNSYPLSDVCFPAAVIHNFTHTVPVTFTQQVFCRLKSVPDKNFRRSSIQGSLLPVVLSLAKYRQRWKQNRQKVHAGIHLYKATSEFCTHIRREVLFTITFSTILAGIIS